MPHDYRAGPAAKVITRARWIESQRCRGLATRPPRARRCRIAPLLVSPTTDRAATRWHDGEFVPSGRFARLLALGAAIRGRSSNSPTHRGPFGCGEATGIARSGYVIPPVER